MNNTLLIIFYQELSTKTNSLNDNGQTAIFFYDKWHKSILILVPTYVHILKITEKLKFFNVLSIVL